MSLINRTGTFRGTILDHGVSASKNGFPQWTPKLQATEYYDEETKTWVDWAGVPENEITGFIILKDGKKKVTLSAQQIVKAIGWSGQSYAELGSMDLNDTKIQFRVDESTFEEKKRLSVGWIDAWDATPGAVVKKLNAAELKKLDAKFGMGKQVTPVSAPTNKPVIPTLPSTPPAAPTLPSTPPPTPPQPTGNSCTKKEAWDNAADVQSKAGVSVEKFTNIWINAVTETGPDEKQFTNQQWYQVSQAVITKVNEIAKK